MAGIINKGLALVSVADVLFFNPTTDEYMGEGLALTNSTLTQEVQSIEQRGGYLNALLFDIKHSKNITVELESATFKMEYLAFQTGTPIVTGLSGVYKFDECVSFTNGVGTTAETPLGNVFVRMPNGMVKKFKPTGKNVDIGMGEFTGSLQVVYQYNETVDQITIDTKTQPLTVKAVMRVHVISQDGVEGYIESISSGLVAGINMYRYLNNLDLIEFDKHTIIGALSKYIAYKAGSFEPMSANLGLINYGEINIRDKKQKNTYL